MLMDITNILEDENYKTFFNNIKNCNWNTNICNTKLLITHPTLSNVKIQIEKQEKNNEDANNDEKQYEFILIKPLSVTNPFTLNESSFKTTFSSLENVFEHLNKTFNFTLFDKDINIPGGKGLSSIDVNLLDDIDIEEHDISLNEDYTKTKTESESETDSETESESESDLISVDNKPLINYIENELENYNYDYLKIYVASPLLIVSFSASSYLIISVSSVFLYFFSIVMYDTGFGTFLLYLLILSLGGIYSNITHFSSFYLHAMCLFYIMLSNLWNNQSDSSLIMGSYFDGFIKCPFILNTKIQYYTDKYLEYKEHEIIDDLTDSFKEKLKNE